MPLTPSQDAEFARMLAALDYPVAVRCNVCQGRHKKTNAREAALRL